MSEAQAKRLAADPSVEYVQADGIYSARGTQNEPALVGSGPHRPAEPAAEPVVHLPRRHPGGDGVRASTPASVTTHSTFGSRATAGTNTVGRRQQLRLPRARHARRRHGRWLHYGVAKTVTAGRPSGCSTAPAAAPTSGIVAGIDWVTANAAGKPAVANMSLGGGADTALDNAVANSIASGVPTRSRPATTSDRERLQLLAGPRPRAAITVGATHEHRRACRRSPTSAPASTSSRPAPGHHVGVEQRRHGHQHDQRHLDGVAARGRRGGAATWRRTRPSTPGAGPERAGRQRHPEQGDQPGHRLAEPAAVRRAPAARPTRRRRAAPAPTPPTCSIPDNTHGVQRHHDRRLRPATRRRRATVAVHIVHTYRGDLVVDLIAPDGTVYALHEPGRRQRRQHRPDVHGQRVEGDDQRHLAPAGPGRAAARHRLHQHLDPDRLTRT